MTTVQIELPDALAQQARQAGLFSSDRMEAILRAQLRREAVAKLRALHERGPREELTPEVQQEIVEAVRKVRAERGQRNVG